MKTPIFLAMTALITTVAAQDIADLLSEAQRAYIRGDLPGAQEKFELVRKLEPQNRVAISYLRRIMAERAREDAIKGPPNATKAALDKLILEKVHFQDAALPEVLEFLRQKGNQLGGGKVAVNFVQKVNPDHSNARVTLKLEKVPFTEVLRYIGDLVDVTFTYERFAIMVTSTQSAPANPAPKQEAKVTEPKIPGLSD